MGSLTGWVSGWVGVGEVGPTPLQSTANVFQFGVQFYFYSELLGLIIRCLVSLQGVDGMALFPSP